MTISEIFTITAAILGSLGGGAIIVGAFAHWLGDIWAKRIIQKEKGKLDIEIENFKVVMKKSEVLFTKEIQASLELSNIVYDITGMHIRISEISEDLLDGVINSRNNIYRKLTEFISMHRIVLHNDTLEELCACVDLAKNSQKTKFKDAVEKRDYAEKIYSLLFSAEEKLLDQVRTQYLS